MFALAVGLLAIYGRAGEPAFRFVESIRRLPAGRLVVLPGSGRERPGVEGPGLAD